MIAPAVAPRLISTLVLAVAIAFAGDQPSEVESLFRTGMSLARAQQWEQARAVFLKGQALAPSDKRFLIELGGVAYKSGFRREAMDRFKRALELDPADHYANDAMGTLWLLEGNLAAALPYWNRIEKPRIRDVLFEAPGAARQDAFRMALEITPGAVLRRGDLEISEANLDRLDVRRYKFNMDPKNDDQFDLTLQRGDGGLIGRNPQGFLIGALSGLPYQTVNLNLRPPWIALNRFDSTFRWDANKKLIRAQLAGLAGNPRLGYAAWADARDERWEIRRNGSTLVPPGRFAMRRVETGAELNAGLSGRLVWSNTAAVSFRDFVGTAIAGAPFRRGWGTKGGSFLSYQLMRNPENGSGVAVTGGAELGRFLEESRPYARLHAGVDGRWSPDRLWELNAAVRAAKTSGPVPFDELFMLGMERDNDLWLRGHVGTYEGRKGNAPMGPDYVVFQSELVRTVWSGAFAQWQVGPLFDSGFASGTFGSQGWLFDAGVVSSLNLLRSVTLTAVAGRDLKNGGTVFYTAIRPNRTSRTSSGGAVIPQRLK